MFHSEKSINHRDTEYTEGKTEKKQTTEAVTRESFAFLDSRFSGKYKFVFSVLSVPPWLFYPTMRIANCDHHRQNFVPSARIHKRLIGEHTAIPTDMLESPARLTFFVAQPITRVLHDVEFSIRRVRQAVPPGLIVRTGTKRFAVVLGDMEVDRPRTQRIRQSLITCLECRAIIPAKSGRYQSILRGVVPHH